MIIFEIAINGTVVTRAGADDMGQIFSFLCANGKLGPRSNAVVADQDYALTFSVTGTTARGGRAPNEELTYIDQDLRVDDTISVRILDEGTGSAPADSKVLDHERMDREWFAEAKEFYLANRARFESNDG